MLKELQPDYRCSFSFQGVKETVHPKIKVSSFCLTRLEFCFVVFFSRYNNIRLQLTWYASIKYLILFYRFEIIEFILKSN